MDWNLVLTIAVIEILTLLFILFTLRGCYYLINKTDPIKALKIPMPYINSMRIDKKAREQKRMEAMS